MPNKTKRPRVDPELAPWTVPAGFPGAADRVHWYAGRTERRRRETFGRLVRISREMLFSRAFDEVTVREITDGADVGKGTFFNYFSSKDGVIPEVAQHGRQTLADVTEQVRGGRMSVAVASTIVAQRSLCPAGGSWLTYEGNLWRALVKGDIRPLVSAELGITRQQWVTLMTLGQAAGTVRADLPAEALGMAAQSFVAGLHCLCFISGTTPVPSLIERWMSPLLQLIEPPPTAASTPEARARPRASGRRRRAPRP